MTTDIEKELGVTTPNTDQLKSLEALVNKHVELSATVESMEAALKGLKADLHELTTKSLPDAMAAAGSSLFRTTAGVKVEIRDFMNGSLPKEDKERKWALSWIEKNGGRDLIKTQVSLALGRGEKSLYEKVTAALVKLRVEFKSKEDIHASTLAAFGRELVRNGKKAPLEKLGLFAGRYAKIELPEEK